MAERSWCGVDLRWLRCCVGTTVSVDLGRQCLLAGGRMESREFAKFIQDKSLPHLLHKARRESLKRILAHDETLEASRPQKPARRRAGSR